MSQPPAYNQLPIRLVIPDRLTIGWEGSGEWLEGGDVKGGGPIALTGVVPWAPPLSRSSGYLGGQAKPFHH